MALILIAAMAKKILFFFIIYVSTMIRLECLSDGAILVESLELIC